MKAKIITILKLSITAIFFYYIFQKIDFHHFAATLRSARLTILIGGFLVLWVGHYICIYRWRMLMRPLMPIPSIGNLFGIYCIGLFFNLLSEEISLKFTMPASQAKPMHKVSPLLSLIAMPGCWL